jgi:hypothetical protein
MTPSPFPSTVEKPALDRLLQSASCPICSDNRVHYAFSIGTTRVLQCPDCGFTFRTVAASSRSKTSSAAEDLLRRIGGERALFGQIHPAGIDAFSSLQVIDWQSEEIAVYPPIESQGEATDKKSQSSNVHLSVGQLDSLTAPLPSLRRLRSNLANTDDKIIFVYSDIRRTGAAVGGQAWEQQVGERNTYLDTRTALTVLYRAGFRCLAVQRLRRRVSLEELLNSDIHHLVASSWRRKLLRLLPSAARRAIHVTSRASDIAILAEPRKTDQPMVSVVIPVFNEAPTVAAVIDTVLRVSFNGAQVEVVIVESNSTDGSREIVQSYANHPRVSTFFEDRPRGKGHATRFGLAKARGDILIIQDADLEYDIEDYHSLIDPIILGHEAFVLGSRHGGRNHWKLRQFSKPILARFYNLAHVLVTGYINLLFGLKLRDPQTMFKVCRRDCVEGLAFHGNYFNFDYELLLKVVRKGYQPVEVPVNYRSRSHAEGKKIRMWRDAPLGLWMITRLWLTPLRRFLTIGERIE